MSAARVHSGLAAQLVESAYRTRELPNASMEPLLTPLVEETTSWLTPLRGSPNLLMLSGLIVTLLGLTYTIASLQLGNGDSEALSAETLSKALPQALSHMGTAFIGSLLGVIGAVLLNWQVANRVRQQQQYVQNLANFAYTVVAPIMIRPRVDAQVEQLTQAITASSEMYQQVRQGIDASTDKFGLLLERAGDIIAGQLAQLQDSAKEVYGTLEKVSGDVKASADALQDSSRDLNTYHGELRNAHAGLEKMFERSQEDLDRRSNELLARMNEMQAEYGRSAQEVMGGVLNAVTRLDGVYAQVGAATERFEQGGERIVGSVHSAFTNLHGMLDGTLTEHKREMTTVSEKLNTFSHNLTQIVDVNRDLQRISEGVKLAEDQRAGAVVAAMEATRTSVSASVQQLAQRLIDQQVVFQDATNHLSERVGLQIGRVTETLLTQPEQFTALLQAHRDQSEALQVSLAEAFEQSTQAIGGLVREQPQVMRTLLDDAAAAQRQAAAEQTAVVRAQFSDLGMHTRDLLWQTADEQGKQFRALFSTQQGGMQSQMSVIGATLAEYAQRFEALIQDQLTLQASSYLKLHERVEALVTSVTDQPQQFETLLAAQNTTNTQLSDVIARQMIDLNDLLTRHIQQSQQSLDVYTLTQTTTMGDLSTRLQPLISALNDQPQHFEVLLSAQSTASAQLTEVMAQQMVTLNDLLVQQKQQAQQSLDLYTVTQTATMGHLTERLQPLITALNTHPQHFETLTSAQSATSAQLTEVMARQMLALQELLAQQPLQAQQLLGQATVQLAAQLTERLDPLLAALTAQPQQYQSLIEAHREALDRLQVPNLAPVVSGLQRLEDQLGQGVSRLEQSFSRLPVPPPISEPHESGVI